MNEQMKAALEQFLEAFRGSDVVAELMNAKEAYVNDGELMSIMNEYYKQEQILREEGAKAVRDENKIAEVTAALAAAYDAATRNEHLVAFQEAQSKVQAVIDDINHGINSIIMPEAVDGGGCSGNCSSCGGCH